MLFYCIYDQQQTRYQHKQSTYVQHTSHHRIVQPQQGRKPDVGKATQFKPGQSGNEAGRPKKTKLTDAYRQLLEQPVPGDPEGRTYAQQIALGMAKSALKGRSEAAREIREGTEGKARQAIDPA